MRYVLICVCCTSVCVCMCMRARRCISTMKILWVLILKPVLRGGIHVIQVSHGIVLPAKLHYHSWGDGVGNSVFPNQVPNREPNTWCGDGSNHANSTVLDLNILTSFEVKFWFSFDLYGNFSFVAHWLISHTSSIQNILLNQDSPSAFDVHNQYTVGEIIQLTLINTLIFYKLHED